jgi:anti-sigma factor RsiW
MTITRDIVTDLLPLYVAGEASADSRAAVEAMLREDAALRRLADALTTGVSVPASFEPPADRVVLARTKALLRRRSWLLGAACFFTGVPFTFSFDGHALQFLMIRDVPSAAIAALVAGVGFWTGFAIVSRQTRVTGL